MFNNNLTSLQPGTFKQLSQLELLNFNDNYITDLDTDLFIGLTNLQYLYLYSNRLTILSKNQFKNMFKLLD